MSPLVEYQARLAARHATHARWTAIDAQIAHARLSVVAVAALLAWLAWGLEVTSPGWLVVPVIAFLALARWHERVIRQRQRAARAITFYEHGLARIEDRWADRGDTGERFGDDEHAFARDLDLFGRGSLFQLLSVARTRAGEGTLASWLTTPAPIPVIRDRQHAVQELRGRLDFREALALAGAHARASTQTEAIASWATGPALLPDGVRRAAAVALAAGAIGTGLWWAFGGPATPFAALIVAEYVFTRAFQPRAMAVLKGADVPGLDALADLLWEIEREKTSTPLLAALHDRLAAEDVPASHAVRRLQRVLALDDWRRNLLFLPIAGLLFWSLHCAWAAEAWRRRFGPRVPAWLEAIGELESLASLAAYAYEHPDDPFPELIADGPARFEAASLGHPLIAASAVVRNDVALTPDVRLLVVSGSNMSGKSTLLRTVGINVVLAQAGAPVRAAHVVMTRFALGATLRIQDSLQAGRSRFYAEIMRVRQLSALADGPLPLLFLLDELFQGTNSHDRLAGAVGVLGSFLDRGAIGLITTHDLALTAIADSIGARVANVHFEDRLDQGELAFDYRMRPGPVTHSNGLALMRAIGLEVPS